MKYLKINLITLFFLLINVLAKAEVPTITYGFSSGVNFAIFTGDEEYDLKEETAFDLPLINAKPIIRYTGGIYLNIPLNERYSLQPELHYSQKGARWRDSGTVDTTEWKMRIFYRLDYIDMPLLLKQRVSDNGYGYFGPQMGLLLYGKRESDIEVKDKISGDGYELSEKKNITQNINALDFSLVAGGSLEFSWLVLDGRFIYSLSSIRDSKFEDVRNFSLSVTAGIKL